MTSKNGISDLMKQILRVNNLFEEELVEVPKYTVNTTGTTQGWNSSVFKEDSVYTTYKIFMDEYDRMFKTQSVLPEPEPHKVEIPCIAWEPTGSRYTCDPPVKYTDEDYIILVENFVDVSQYDLLKLGFKRDAAEQYENTKFSSYRKGHLNYIVTDDKEFYSRFCLATKVAKELNLKKKRSRISLFNAILND